VTKRRQPDAPAAIAPSLQWRSGEFRETERLLPEETPVALVHDATTTAVMMASPLDFEDLALGFAFTEGIIAGTAQVRSIEIVPAAQGVEARMWLSSERSARLAERRRATVGPSGCGLCGVESLDQAARELPRAPHGVQLSPAQLLTALEAVSAAQAVGRKTRATHAAGFWRAGDGLVAVREDVGRHNALDKLAGALLRRGEGAADGVIVLTSRVSIEMVQKAAILRAAILVAVSAPTALAVRAAEDCGMTLVAVARDDGFEVFTGRQRITG
jgi:FdhD protein